MSRLSDEKKKLLDRLLLSASYDLLCMSNLWGRPIPGAFRITPPHAALGAGY